jgi:hypothetical protein
MSIRIIAVMVGRLRMSIDQTIENFEHIWQTMGATLSRYDRVIPFRKAKASNTRGFDRAFQQLLSKRKRQFDECFPLRLSLDTIFGTDALSDDFASDPELCKTLVTWFLSQGLTY